MKEIPNITFSIKLAPTDEKPATTASFIKITLDQRPEQGFDRATMKARQRVDDFLSKAEDGGVIKLEDADYATARQCAEQFKWGLRHPDILKFLDLFGL